MIDSRLASANVQLKLDATRAISKKVTAHLDNKLEMPAEQKLFVAVICAAITDLAARSDIARRKAWSYLIGDRGDIGFASGLAGIEVDYIQRVVNEVAKAPDAVCYTPVIRKKRQAIAA